MKAKTTKILSILILAMAMIGASVSATSNSFRASATPSTTTLKPGEEVTITVKVSDINMGENGINTLEGKIKYDTNVFESVKASDVQSLNNWSTTYNDETSSLNGKFLAVNLSAGTKDDTQILSVKFKVKDDIKETTTTQIDFEDITSNDGTDLVNAGTKSVSLTVNVEEKQPEEPVKPIIPPTTEAPGKLPQTGDTLKFVAIMLVVTLITICIAIRYRRMRDVK